MCAGFIYRRATQGSISRQLPRLLEVTKVQMENWGPRFRPRRLAVALIGYVLFLPHHW